MSQNRRSRVRRRRAQSRRRKSFGRNRLLVSPERLEDRTLLAGDLLASGLSPWQNPYQPTDVNFDLETTPLDALIVINSLNSSGPHSLAPASPEGQQPDAATSAEAENGAPSVFVDVNGDMELTPLDVLTVVDAINQPDGEAGDIINFSTKLTDLDGNPLPNRDQDPQPEVVTGNEFLFQVFVDDKRSPPPRLGVFSAYPVVPVDFTLVSTAYQEVQRLTVDPTATGGTFNIQFNGNTSAPIPVTDLMPSATSAAALQSTLQAIPGIGAGNVEVSRAAYLTFDVVFTGDLANRNVADLVPVNVDLNSDGTPIAGNPVTVQQTVAADPDSQASFFSAYQSATNLAAGGIDNRTYKFSPSGSVDKADPAAGRLMNIGAAASIVQVGQTFEIDWAPDEGPTTPSLLFAVRFMADNAGTLKLQPSAPIAGDAYTPDELTYWPSTGQSAEDRLNLFPLDPQNPRVDFGLPAVVDIIELATAVDDNVPPPPVLEDSGQTLIDVLANDTTVSGTKNLESIVTQPASGTASVSGSQVAYQPNADFNGQDTFVYRMNDGGGNTDTATVTVNVTAVNDAPEFTPLSTSMTIDEDAGAQTVNGWATGIRPGPAAAVDEAQQVLTFNETLLNPGGDKLQAADFVTPPAVNETTGDLTFELKPNVNGQAVVEITLSDDGGTANGGADTSPAQTLTITVDAVNDPPVNRINGDADFTAHAQTVRTDQVPLVLSSANNNALSVDDADGNVSVEVTLSVSNGTLDVTPTQGVTIQNNGQATVTLSGLRDDVNNALDGNTVTYTPSQGFLGLDPLTMTTSDLGNTGKDPGTSGGDTFEQDEDTLQIEVIPPSRPFASSDQVTVDEDSGASAPIQVLANDFDGNGDRPPASANFQIVNSTQPPAGEGTVQLAGAGTTATFTYTTDQDFFGSTTFTYEITDDPAPDGNSVGTVTVTVNPVNDEPAFTASDPAAVNEDAGAQIVSGWAAFDAGPDNEDATQQVLQYTVSDVSNPGLFAAGPAVDTNGTLSYTPADDANGSSTFAVAVQDNGGTASGGDDTSPTQTFTITVNPVNDAPSFTASDPSAVDEDAGAQTVAAWATNFVPGPADEAGQSLVRYTVSNVSNPGLFAAAPAVANDGTLTYTPAADANGSSTFEVTVQDDGGTDRGGVDTSPAQTFTITVNAVNDAPSFAANDPAPVEEDAGPQSIANWATLFDPGPANESSQQVLAYNVNVVENPGLFAAGPAVATDGTLSYTPAPDQNGQAKFTVAVQDDGGTANNGVDTSPSQTFTVTVNAVNDAPVNTINGEEDFLNNNQTTDDNVDLAFNQTNANLLGITDVDDDGSTTYQVDVEVTNGTLSLGGAPPAGVTVTDVNGDATHLRLDSAASLANINTALDGLTYSPTPNFIGEGVLTITSRDGGTSGSGGEKTDTDSLTITVAPFNDPPVAQDDNVATAEGAASTFNVFDDNGNGADSAGPNEAFQDIDVWSFDASNTVGTVELLDAETGSFRYTPPDDDFNGATTFTYTIQDDGQSRIDGVIQDDFKQDTATVTVTVTEVNDAPTADDDLLLIDPNPQVGQQFTFSVSDVLVNDAPGPANESGQILTVTDVTNSPKGAAVILDDKGTPDPNDDTITYTVPDGFDHMDTFTYTITDDGTTNGDADPLTATGTVTVRDVVPSDVTGFAFDDLNGDGQKNDGEPGIAGVKITLEGRNLVPNSPLVHEEVWTDEDGRYVFAGILPNLDGFSYTITETQPAHFEDGAEAVHSALDDANDQQEAADAIPAGTNDVIQVTLPLLGYDDGGNDNNNFGEMGLAADLASIDYRDLLHSDQGDEGPSPITEMGLMFAVDANGNLQWKINVGGWRGYVPGEKADGSNTYANAGVATSNGKSWRVTDTVKSQVQQLDLEDRVRWKAAGTSTVYRIFGAADHFGLDLYTAARPAGEGEPITEGRTVELLAAGGGAAEYAAAVDAVLAEAAEVSA